MNKNTPRLAAATAALLLLGTAHAEGLYLGANLGTPDYRSSIASLTGNGSGLSGKVYGGWGFTPNFALEAGYTDLGHVENGGNRVRGTGVFVDAVGTLPLASNWSLLARAGLAQARFHTPLGSDSSPALKLGLGAEYALSKTVSLRAEYEHYRFTNLLDSKASVGQATVGVKLAF